MERPGYRSDVGIAYAADARLAGVLPNSASPSNREFETLLPFQVDEPMKTPYCISTNENASRFIFDQ